MFRSGGSRAPGVPSGAAELFSPSLAHGCSAQHAGMSWAWIAYTDDLTPNRMRRRLARCEPREVFASTARFVADSPLEGVGFEPSVPRLQWSSVQLAARDGTMPPSRSPGGPEGSNLLPSTGESTANLISLPGASPAHILRKRRTIGDDRGARVLQEADLPPKAEHVVRSVD